jgi:hypothetical protein
VWRAAANAAGNGPKCEKTESSVIDLLRLSSGLVVWQDSIIRATKDTPKLILWSGNRTCASSFGDLPLVALADRLLRGEFKALRDSFAITPRKADYAWTTLARIMSFAKDRGMIATTMPTISAATCSSLKRRC